MWRWNMYVCVGWTEAHRQPPCTLVCVRVPVTGNRKEKMEWDVTHRAARKQFSRRAHQHPHELVPRIQIIRKSSKSTPRIDVVIPIGGDLTREY